MTIVDVIEDVCEDGKQNLHGRLVLMLMRAGILVGEVVVLVVGVMVVVAVCVISFSEKLCLSLTDVKCLGMVLGWWEEIFLTWVEVLLHWGWKQVDDLELEKGAVVRKVKVYLNSRLYFFCF